MYTDIWESKEDFERFGERLGPAMQEIVGEGAPEPTPQFYEIETLVDAA